MNREDDRILESYLCLDIGGSKYVVGVIRRDGTIVHKRGGKWPCLTADQVMKTLIDESRLVLQECGEQPIAIGATIPGLTDAERGLWVEASFSGIRNLPICQLLSDAFGLPAYCENDGSAYALAEMVFGCCKDVQDFLFMNVSNGIGGAIVAGGRLLRGATGSAGEFGHCHIVDGGRVCKCGQQGCLEAYAAGPAIARNYIEAGGEPADAKLIAQRAREGCPHAKAVYHKEGEYLGRVLATAINLFNPRRVVIGGGVALAFDLFEESLRNTVSEQIYTSANPHVDICATPLGYDAGLCSGAAIAISQREHLFGY